MPRKPANPQTPVETDGIEIGAPAEAAAGLPAIAATFTHLQQQTGVVRGARTLLRMNQKHGFDCPGCAWPEPNEHRSHLEFCENGAKAIAEESTNRRADAAFFARYSVAELSAQSDYWLSQQGRLTEPFYLAADDDHYRPISWASAFEKIATHLNALPDPDRAVFYTSGRTSNEAAFLYQLFVRRFGTNNFPDCSNMCHETSGVAMKEAIGIGTGTVHLDDFEHADLILVIGQNPGSNHPRMLATLQKAARRGCHIVSINPLRETGLKRFKHPQEPHLIFSSGTELAKTFLQVRLNGDVALLKGLCKAVLDFADAHAGQGIDRDFIAQYCEGFDAFAEDLHATDWPEIVADSGIAEASIRELAARFCQARNVIACWAMGLTQQPNGVANIQYILNLLLMGGHMGRRGAGACPVRGHSNVQGDRTMGINEQPGEGFLDRLAQRFAFTPPRQHGMNTVESIKAMLADRVGVFFAMGGNFLSATPDTELTAQALRRCALTAQVSIKLNRSHLVTGREALILPCLGRTERDQQAGGAQCISTENSMSVISRSEGVLEPASPQLLSEVAIVAGLAQATLGANSGIDWQLRCDDYAHIRRDIEAVIPGFADYNLRLERDGGFTLPHPVRDERRFHTANGQAVFAVSPLPKIALGEGEFLMMSIRSHDQYNTTIYGLDDRYRGIRNGRRVVLMNAADMARCGLHEGQLVDIHSHFRGELRRAPQFRVVSFDIPVGCLATYYPETNVLVALDNHDSRSFTPASKSVVVTLHA